MNDVCVAWLDAGQTEGEFTLALAALLLHDRRAQRVGNIVRVCGGVYVDRNRGDAVRDFLDSDFEWLFMLDADMAWDADSLHRLLEVADPVERPIVAGLYFSGGRMGGVMMPMIFELGADGHTRPVLDFPRDAIIEIHATGGGFCLWHRSVFEKMAESYGTLPDGSTNPLPFFADEIRDGRQYGEDIVACLRARALGFPIFMHTGVTAIHKKPAYLTVGFYDQLLAQRDEA
ncbi:MAG: hypothetical protein AB7L84_09840 [Acidimicrobiia bacterium]